MITEATQRVIEAYQGAQSHPDHAHWGDFYPQAWAWCVRMGAKYHRSPQIVADVVAALSPLRGWDQNLKLAERALRLTKGIKTRRGLETRLRALPTMQRQRDAVARAIDGHGVSGPKVTAFAANIRGDMVAVTIDRHMMDLTQTQDINVAATAITAAALHLGKFPAEVQATTWGYHRHTKGYKTYA